MSARDQQNQPAKNKKAEIISTIKTLILLVILAIFIRAIIFEPYKIPSESMLPTLQVGDHVLVTKFDYGVRFPFIKKMLWQLSAPERGQIVVFTRPNDPATQEDDSKINIIKRVIGLPGDSVEIKRSQVYINGKPYDEPYAVWVEGGAAQFPTYKVPENSVLLLGDNRDHSKDSRYWSDPFIEISRIKGKARWVFFNLNNLKRAGNKLY